MRGRFFSSHVATRLLFGLTLFGLLATGQIGLLLIVSALLIVMLDESWRNLVRALRVLRWFLVPILLLHLVFSGGERLWPESGLPLSLEGLKTGLWLSLKLMTFYSLAMLLSRLLLREELLSLLAALPKVGARLYPYTLSMHIVRQSVQLSLNQFRQQFQLRRDWRRTGVMLASLLHQMLRAASSCTHLLWLRWPTVPHRTPGRMCLKNELPVLVASGMLWGLTWLR